MYLPFANAGKWQKCKIYFGAWPVARAGEARGRKGARRLLEAADIGWAMEFVTAGGARDGCWKPQILHSLAAKAPGEGTLQWAVMDFVGRAAGLDKTGCWNDSRGTQGRRSWGVYPAC